MILSPLFSTISITTLLLLVIASSAHAGGKARVQIEAAFQLPQVR